LRSLTREVGDEAIREHLGARTQELAPLVPRLSTEPAPPIDRLALFAATQDLLIDLSAKRSLVLVVEDLHWADESSTDLIRFWSRTVTHGRLMLLITSRDAESEDMREALDDLRRTSGCTLVPLAPLAQPDLETQIRCMDDRLSPDEVAEIGRLSG